MSDLLYVLQMGFSGSDLQRALYLILGGSFFVSRRLRPWKVTAALLAGDAVWPYASMVMTDGSHHSAELALRAAATDWQDYSAGWIVRAVGFYGAILGVYSLRAKLHEGEAAQGEPRKKLLPF